MTISPPRRTPARRTVLFDSFGGRYSDNPRAVSEALRRRRAPVDHVWVLEQHAGPVADDVTAVAPGSAAHLAALQSADAIVANDVLPYAFRKSPGTTYLQTWHGSPLKRVGFDVPRPSWPGSERHYGVDLGRDIARWDVLLSPNAFSTELLPRAFAYDGPVFETGYPRNDVLFAADRDAIRGRVRRELQVADDVLAVLYVPTWRDGDYFSLALDPDELEARLGRRSVVLVRAHGLLARTGARVQRHPVLRDVTHHQDVRDLYLAADALVTDYSSAMVDFAVTGKPLLFYVYDLERYRDELRGFYVDVWADAPGAVTRTTAELAAELARLPASAARHADAYGRFRARFCHRDDGRAGDRVADLLLERLGDRRAPTRSRRPADSPAVVVLAAGRGSRLGDLAADLPKWLVPVNGRPIADYHLGALRSAPSAWSRLVVVTGHGSGALDADALSRLAGRRCELAHNPAYADFNNWLSLACGLDHLAATGWTGDVCVLNSDLLLPAPSLQAVLGDARADGNANVLAVDSARALSDESMKVATADGGRVVDVGKHGLRLSATGEFIGLSTLAAAHVPALREILAGFAADRVRHDDWYEGAYREAIDAGIPFRALEVGTRDWVEIDDERDLRVAARIAARYDA